MAMPSPHPETPKRPDTAPTPASAKKDTDRPAPIRFSDWASI